MLWRPQDQFTDFVDREFMLSTLGVDDADFHIREWQADRPDLVFSLNRVYTARHHSFGQRVALDNARTGGVLEAPLRFCHQCRGSAEAQLDTAQVGFATSDVRVVQNRGVKRWNAVEERGFYLTDCFQQIADVARIGDQ